MGRLPRKTVMVSRYNTILSSDFFFLLPPRLAAMRFRRKTTIKHAKVTKSKTIYYHRVSAARVYESEHIK